MASTAAATSPATPFRRSPHRRCFLSPPQPLPLLSRPLFHSPVLSLRASRGCVRSRVTAAPVERSPLPEFEIRREIARLEELLERLGKARGLKEKLEVLEKDSRVRVWEGFSGIVDGLGDFDVFLVMCVVAAGQGHVVGWVEEEGEEESAVKSAFRALAAMVEKWSGEGGGGGRGVGEVEEVKELLGTLSEVERFYDCIGGVIGYQKMVLGLLLQSSVEHYSSHHPGDSKKYHSLQFHVPNGVNLLKDTEYASQAALWGLEGLPKLGEIYPLGGAGDRLGLVNPSTGECLPAAMLPYCGRTLLEGLVRDLQAREFLHFKIFGYQCITPVAIMTSAAKHNHAHITTLCEKLQWFGRGRQNFQLFEQPLVPVVSAEDGQWMISKPFSPICKPGGHGAIWKLAHDKGIFKWFHAHGRKGVTVRQVSNVVAATDVTLLALAGTGLHHEKKLGFVSCERNTGATEGINVLVEKKNLMGQWEYGITCIEYTEFEKMGIDASRSTMSSQPEFPANTNILYVDLASAEKIGSRRSIASLPGMVLNLKKPVPYSDHFGIQHSVSGGRLECTMQSIADNFVNTYSSRCNKSVEETLDTFILYNERKRVTSSAKRKRKKNDKSLHQTPDGSLLDIIRNATDILSHCNINIPKIEDNSKYFHSRPPFLILLHPALGPLWEITRQKFSGGSISEDSELQLEVTEFSWKNVQLEGSLTVLAENVMGSIRTYDNGDPMLQYGYRSARCKLHNVQVQNKGINWDSAENVYWKHDVERFETLSIILHGNAEFEAMDVILQGNHVFEVPDGHRMSVTSCSSNSGFSTKLEPIPEEMTDGGSWFWRYKIEGTHIKLEMVES